MAVQVTIYNITGQSPYDVYVCQADGSGCFYMTTIQTVPYTFDIPAPYNNASSYMLKLVDDNNCTITSVQDVSLCDTTPTPTPALTETPTSTPTSTTTPTSTATSTSTPTSTPTSTTTPTQTQTQTPSSTVGSSPQPTTTPTQTPTQTSTETPTQTSTQTPTQTSTNTPTNTPSETPTQTPTQTNTETPTQTPTQTMTQTPSETPGCSFGSAVFDGTAGQSLGMNPGLIFGTSSFTIEGWIYSDNLSFANSGILSTTEVSGLELQITTGTSFVDIVVSEYFGGGNNFGFSTSFVPNTWNYFAVARSGNTETAWFNGIRSTGGTITDTQNYSGHTTQIGSYNGTAFDGNITNLRAVIGQSLYDPASTTISIPTQVLGNIPNAYLVLQESSASNLLYDSALYQTITNNNGVTWSSLSPTLACPSPFPVPTHTPTPTSTLNLCILSSTTITTSGSTSCPGNDDEVTSYTFQLTDLLGNPVTILNDVNLELQGTSLPCGSSSTPVTVPLTIAAGTSYVDYSFYSKQYDSNSPCLCGGFDTLSFTVFSIVTPFPPYSSINFCGLIPPTPSMTPTYTPTNPIATWPLSYTGTNQSDACDNLNFNIGTPATYYTIGYPTLGSTVYTNSIANVPLVGVNAVTLNGEAWGLDPLNGQINASAIIC
jgi:hypothetical protein